MGELILTDQDIAIESHLKSSICVCLYSNENQSGGIIQFSHPCKPDGRTEYPLQYGDYALTRLIESLEDFTHNSAPCSTFKAKIIGCANKKTNENLTIVRKILHQYSIEIIAEDVSESQQSRHIIFYPHSGRLQIAIGADSTDSPSNLKNQINQRATSQSSPQRIPQPLFQSHKKTKVLIVDDSKTIRQILTNIIGQDPEMEIIGQAENALEAEKLLDHLKPDVITLDVHMPGMTGVEWLEKLIPQKPIPVVMITSMQWQEGNEVFRALELGAVDYIQKPEFHQINDLSPMIREKIKNASQAKVRPLSKKLIIRSHKQNQIIRRSAISTNEMISYKSGLVIAMGASTGGTEALREVLTCLPSSIPPILIVQHIPPVFSKAFADRLNDLCPFEVREAKDGDLLKNNCVLVAPGGYQMKLEKSNHHPSFHVKIIDDPPMNRHKPSVDYLFNSIAHHFGKKSIGVILTGMGSDGARGLLNMKKSGAMTLSQDESTCVVYGMPKAAVDMNASDEVIKLESIAEKIIELSKVSKAA